MAKRKVEVFTAGCYLCDEAVALVRDVACDSCEVTVVDVTGTGAKRARRLGVSGVPAVVIDGEISACCDTRGVTLEGLQVAGVGKPA